jgi:hypothetical protein
MCIAFSVAGWSQSPAAAGFEKLKTLVGEWQETSSEKTPVRVSYQLTSGGSALMETIRAGKEGDMLTVYHRDNDSLLMTHYCMVQNQPRMRARPKTTEIRELKFDFVDVSNLSTPDAAHMRGLLLTFEDANHITAKWIWKEKGQEQEHAFHLTRQQ